MNKLDKRSNKRNVPHDGATSIVDGVKMRWNGELNKWELVTLVETELQKQEKIKTKY